MDLGRLFQLALPLSVGATVFAFGLSARREDVWLFVERPGLAFRSLVSLNLVGPAIALLLSALLKLDPGLEVALVALGVSPVAPLIPWRERKSGGNDAYAIGLLFGSAVLAIPLVPASVLLIARVLGADVAAPASAILKILLVTVLAPIVLAVLVVGLVGRDRSRRMSTLIVKGAIGLLVVAFLPILLGSLKSMLTLIGNGTLLAIALQVGGALLAGHWLGGRDRADRTVLALSSVSRHPAVAFTVAKLAAPDQPDVGAAILLYMLVAVVGCSLYLHWQHRPHHPDPTGAPLAPA